VGDGGDFGSCGGKVGIVGMMPMDGGGGESSNKYMDLLRYSNWRFYG
jgi:hypothetical protein